MEVGQADDMFSKHDYFMKNKKHSISLSKSKVAFAKDFNDDSIVLRNLYPKIEDIQSVFLLARKEYVETFYYALIGMVKEKIDVLQRRVKYVRKCDFDEIKLMAEEKRGSIENLGEYCVKNKN